MTVIGLNSVRTNCVQYHAITAYPITEWSNLLDRDWGDPGRNLGMKMLTSWRWLTKYTPYCLCIFVISDHGTVPLIGPGCRAFHYTYKRIIQ